MLRLLTRVLQQLDDLVGADGPLALLKDGDGLRELALGEGLARLEEDGAARLLGRAPGDAVLDAGLEGDEPFIAGDFEQRSADLFERLHGGGVHPGAAVLDGLIDKAPGRVLAQAAVDLGLIAQQCGIAG